MGARLAIGACPARRLLARTAPMTQHRTPARLAGLAAVGFAALAATSTFAFPQMSAVDLAQQGDDPAWAITAGLTTEIGPRPARTDREAAAANWPGRKPQTMGFAHGHGETQQN